MRLVSTPSRTVSGDTAYAPFGYGYGQSGRPALSFTGQNQDTAANLYDFMYREYGIQGRWVSPDPLGQGAFNLADPQSLDRYAYVRNSPMGLVDPWGLWLCRGTTSCTVVVPPPPPPQPFAFRDYLRFLTDALTINSCALVCAVLPSPNEFLYAWAQVLMQDVQAAMKKQRAQGSSNQRGGAPQQPQTPRAQQKPGWCTAMENGGTTVVVVAGGVFVWGTVADATGIGAPVGLFSQGSATLGMVLGGIVDGLGKVGKAAGVCQ